MPKLKSWTEVSLPSSGYWSSVAYGDGKFVAVCRGTSNAAYSADGAAWISATLPSSSKWTCITYGGGKFVAVAEDGSSAAYSSDGITWTGASLPEYANWNSVAYGNGKYVVVANSQTKAAYSEDGITWTAMTLPTADTQYWKLVTFGNGKFVVFPSVGTVALCSTDGINWSTMGVPNIVTNWGSLAYGDGNFVAAGGVYSSNYGAYSPDGVSWSLKVLPAYGKWNSVFYGNGLFVAVAYDNSQYLYSADGQSWTAASMPSASSWTCGCYGNNRYVAITYTGSKAAYAEKEKEPNKVIYNGSVLIDLTGDTATAADVINSKKLHVASGDTVTGTCTYDADTSDANAASSEILATKTGYVAGTKVAGTMTNVGAQTGYITTVAQEEAISAGYHDGSGKVSIDATEQAKIIESNIRKSTVILGVTGTLEPGTPVVVETSKSATPTSALQTVLPSTGYDAMAQVVLDKIPYTEVENPQGGKTVTIG